MRLVLRSRLILIPLAALVLAGCGGDSSSSGTGIAGGPDGSSVPGKACTEIGCSSGLFVDLTPVAQAERDARRVRLCLDSHCEDFKPGDPLAMVTELQIGEAKSVEVSMTVFGAGGKVLHRERTTQELKRVQPNGHSCKPVCFQVSLDVDPKTLHLSRTIS
jgi:hypothetical protein